MFAGRRSGGSTVFAPSRLPSLTNGWPRTERLWEQRLDALHTEVARGKRERRSAG